MRSQCAQEQIKASLSLESILRVLMWGIGLEDDRPVLLKIPLGQSESGGSLIMSALLCPPV